MLTQYQRVFKRLMAGESISQIRRDIPSASALQRGIQMYVEEREKIIPEFQEELGKLERKRKEVKGDLQRSSSARARTS